MLGAVALALLTASPASADGGQPTTPTELFSAYRPCATDANAPALLSAGQPGVLLEGIPQGSDPTGHDQLAERFQVWSVADPTHSTTLTYSYAVSGLEATATLPTAFTTDGTTYAWQAQSVLGSQTSDWSDTCYFTVDDTAPSAPTVTSSNYVQGARNQGGVPVEFTFDANGTDDVIGFVFGWNSQLPGIGIVAQGPYGVPQPSDPFSDTAHVVHADPQGGSATVHLSPPGHGYTEMWVASFDRALNRSAVSKYEFFVTSTAPTVAPAPGQTPQYGTATTFRITPDPQLQAISPVVSYSVAVNDSGSGPTVQVPAAADGTAEVALDLDRLPDNVVHVTSLSANGWVSDVGDWSYLFDTTPTVSSDVYPENASGGGVGVPGTFTFAPKVPGVASYTYLFDWWGDSVTVPADADHKAVVDWTPDESGPHDVLVSATTEDGTQLAPYDYFFTVN